MALDPAAASPVLADVAVISLIPFQAFADRQDSFSCAAAGESVLASERWHIN
jgi:hypothetical protein